MPYAYGDKRRLTPEIHRQYLDRFPDAWRGTVLWQLAAALLGSSAHYDRLWQQRAALADRPSLHRVGAEGSRVRRPSSRGGVKPCRPPAWSRSRRLDIGRRRKRRKVLRAMRSFLADTESAR